MHKEKFHTYPPKKRINVDKNGLSTHKNQKMWIILPYTKKQKPKSVDYRGFYIKTPLFSVDNLSTFAVVDNFSSPFFCG